jgi:hypothetical protein
MKQLAKTKMFFGQRHILYIFAGGLECVGHSFANVAYLWFLRYVWFEPMVLP